MPSGAWPHGPSRGTGAESARALIRTMPRVRGRKRLGTVRKPAFHACNPAAVRDRTGQFAPWGPGPQWGPFRTDRAGRRDRRRNAAPHREAKARPRRWLRWDLSGFFPAANGPSRARDLTSRLLPARQCARPATRPVRPRTGGVPPLSFRALERRLTLALDREVNARPRRWLCWDLSGLAERKKPAWPVRPRTGGVPPLSLRA